MDIFSIKCMCFLKSRMINTYKVRDKFVTLFQLQLYIFIWRCKEKLYSFSYLLCRRPVLSLIFLLQRLHNGNNHINPPRKDASYQRAHSYTSHRLLSHSRQLDGPVYIIKPSSPSAYVISLRLRTSLKLHAGSFFFLSFALVSLQSSRFHLRALAASFVWHARRNLEYHGVNIFLKSARLYYGYISPQFFRLQRKYLGS